MVAVQYVYNVLHNDWQTSISGRPNDVPQPYIFIESSEATRFSTATADYMVVTDNGQETWQPQSVGWTEERVEAKVAVEMRTAHSRERLLGYRDQNNVAERYGGLLGETKRILNAKRKGDKEWDYVIVDGFDDLTGDVGFANFRGRLNIRLVSVASQINP